MGGLLESEGSDLEVFKRCCPWNIGWRLNGNIYMVELGCYSFYFVADESLARGFNACG